jgi:hypothetical protein
MTSDSPDIAARISIPAIAPIITAVGDREWGNFKALEAELGLQYGVEVWKEALLNILTIDRESTVRQGFVASIEDERSA